MGGVTGGGETSTRWREGMGQHASLLSHYLTYYTEEISTSPSSYFFCAA